jgi:carbon monoxide dehydrogenase subunit G
VNINETAVIGAPIEEVWAFVTDVPRVGGCLPGTEEVTDLGGGAFGGAMKVKVGAISVRLEGRVRMVERDEASHVATLAIEAADRRVKGSVNATTRMTLASIDATTTELSLDTDAAVVGKLGQFGQAVIQKKTRQILDDFVDNMTLQLTGGAPAEARVTAVQTEPATATASGTRTVPAPTRERSATTPVTSGVAATGSSPLGLLVSAAGVAVGAVGAARSDTSWAILGLSLVAWGSFGFPRRSVG